MYHDGFFPAEQTHLNTAILLARQYGGFVWWSRFPYLAIQVQKWEWSNELKRFVPPVKPLEDCLSGASSAVDENGQGGVYCMGRLKKAE